MAANEDNEQHQILVTEEGIPTVSTNPSANTVEVDADDPSQVYVTIGGTATSPATLLQAWGYPEEIRVKVGQGRFHIPLDAVLLGVSATIDTPSQGDDIVLDVNNDGVSVFPDLAAQPVITEGANLAPEVTVFDDPLVDAGSVLTVDVDQVGTVQPGRDLTVTVRYRLQ